MQILIVEDDYLQSAWIYDKLSDAMPNVKLSVITTESEFRSRFDEIANAKPDIVILDVMLRWADPSPSVMDQPANVRDEGFYRAGLRCERMLESDERTRHIPVILYTVLERVDLMSEINSVNERVFYLPKESDIGPLEQKIRELAIAH